MNRIERLAVVVVLTTLTVLVYRDAHEARAWRRFVADHHCQEVARTPGNLIHTTPDRTVYRCDDGKTYER